MSISLDFEILSNGTMQITRPDGEVVGKVTPRPTGGFLVQMVGFSVGWDVMPVRSLEAGQYLVLAGVLEHDATV